MWHGASAAAASAPAAVDPHVQHRPKPLRRHRRDRADGVTQTQIKLRSNQTFDIVGEDLVAHGDWFPSAAFRGWTKVTLHGTRTQGGETTVLDSESLTLATASELDAAGWIDTARRYTSALDCEGQMSHEQAASEGIVMVEGAIEAVVRLNAAE